MRVVSLSYNTNNRYKYPETWIKRIKFFTGILEALSQYGEVISIHFINYQDVKVINNVANHFLKYSPWKLWIPIGFHRYVKNLSPDVVIVHGLIFPWQVLLLRWQIGKVKIIVQHHAERPLRWHKRLFQILADRHIKAYVFASAELGRLWVDKGLIRDAAKVREVMEASSPFKPVDRGLARSVTRVNGTPAYLWVGRLNPNKDPVTVVNAFVRFLKDHPLAKLFLIFQSDELVEELKAILNKFAYTKEAIRLVGKIDYDDLLHWYNSADFIVSGSHYEGSGIAICEAMSCGCIPVITDIPSFRTITAGGSCGILYKAGQEEALFEALRKSASMDIHPMKEKVLTHFRNRLSFEAIAEQYYEVITE